MTQEFRDIERKLLSDLEKKRTHKNESPDAKKAWEKLKEAPLDESMIEEMKKISE